jgi:hypothetical protein
MHNTLTTPILRKFGFTLSLIFIMLFGLLLPLYADKNFPLWPFVIGGVLSAFALILPKLLKFVYIPWMKLGHGLGFINTRIILGVIFFVLITPLGFVMRRFGYNPMTKGYDPQLTTYRKITPAKPIQHMEKPF